MEEAIKVLKSGGIILCPTDTVYGLIADATNKKAVERIFKMKKRSKNKPLAFFVSDLKMAKQLAFINKDQEKILKSIWPGKTTVVLKRKKYELYGAKKTTIALRILKYKLIIDLIKKIKKPLAQTSANISGRMDSVKIKEVIKQFEDQKLKPDLIINKSNLNSSKPSTIIDLTGKKLKILRK